MNKIREYEEMLSLRYGRLYGDKNNTERVNKARKKILIQLVIIIIIFITAVGYNIAVSKNEYKNAVFNDKGEITGIVRPAQDEGVYSFTARVKIVSDKGIREKEYFITVEPLGEAVAENESITKEVLSSEEQADTELKRLISQINENTAYERIELPAKLETGEVLIWNKAENHDLVLYLIGLIAGLLLVYRNGFYGIKREEQAAKESIIRELPDFINKLVLFTNAGVILNSAFLKIVDDCDIKKVESSYFYKRLTDISRVVRETNGSFYKEMYTFAKNSGVKEMMRITNIMIENVSKGDDLAEKLKRENELLWFARKQQAEEKGKLAETKLTLPLMLLLSVLIVITIAPALMEI